MIFEERAKKCEVFVKSYKGYEASETSGRTETMACQQSATRSSSSMGFSLVSKAV